MVMVAPGGRGPVRVTSAKDVAVAKGWQAQCKLCPWVGDWLASYQDANTQRLGHLVAHESSQGQ